MDRPQLGYYRIEGIVGVGRTGIVYLATDTRTGRAVALKVLRDDVGIDPVYRERFRREGSLLAALSHPHIVPIYGMGEIDGELYIATRLVTSTLKQLILQGPLELDVAMRILTAVATAVDTAHAAGVVHRDIKPANVLFDAADIYAFACLAIETLTGDVPFPRGTDAAVMYAHVIDPPPSLHERRPELPKLLDEAIARGMAKDPDDRPPTARALLMEMLQALGRPVPARLAAAA
jgi:serine/threonine protein kinase